MEPITATISVVGTAGVALVVAAVVGGGFSLAGMEVPVISSVIRQVIVGLVGAILLAVDLMYVSDKNGNVGPPTTTTTEPDTTTTSTTRPTMTSRTEPPSSCPDARSQPVRSGSVNDVDPRSGIDLDCGLVTRTEADHGADVSGRVQGIFMDTVSTAGSLAWLDDLAPDDFARCLALRITTYTKTLRDLDKPRPDGGICVRTSEGNIAILKLRRPSTSSSPGLSFDYRIQYPQR